MVQAGIGRVGLAAWSAADALRPTSFDDVLSRSQEGAQQSGAVRAAAFHRPDQSRAWRLLGGPGDQLAVAVRARLDGDGRDLAASAIDKAGGVRVGG